MVISALIAQKGRWSVFWVAVKELKLSYHNGCIYIYIVNSRVSPV